MGFIHNKKLRLALTILFSILFLYIVFRTIQFDAVLSAFKSYNYWWLLPVTFLVIFNIYLRAIRWKLILKPIKKIKTHLLFEAIVLSYFTNILLVLNIGEIVKAYFLKKKTKLSMSSCFASLAIERIIGILGFLIVGIFAVSFVSMPEISSKINLILLTTLGIFFLLVLFILLLKKFRDKIYKFVHYINNKITKKNTQFVDKVFHNFINGLKFGASKFDIFLIIVYSVFIRILYALLTFSIAKGFGIDLPFLIFLFIDVLVTFGHMLGSHIGIVGTYEAILTYSLVFFGVAKEIGLSIALIADITFILPSLILGFIYFMKEGFSFKKIRKLK